MADDISIIVKVLGQSDIVKTTKSLKAMENGVKSLSKDLDKGRISEKQFNTGLKELRRTVDSSFPTWQKAKSSVDAYAKSVRDSSDALKQAKIDQEVAKVSASYDRLKASIDPVFAAQQRMKKAHTEIRAALKAELITRDEAAASLVRYRNALKAGTVAGAQTRRTTNQLGVIMQQTGYQVGDFAVQVQSGTNVMVALGQQATQLVGTFGMFAKSTKMIGLFAGLGIATPIITGVAAALMRTRQASKEAEVQLKSTSEMLKELNTSASDAAKELRVLFGVFKDIADLETFLKLEAIEGQISKTAVALEKAKNATGRRASGQDALQEKIEALELEKQQLIAANERRLANEELLEIEKSYQELMGELLDQKVEEAEAEQKIADKRKESQAAFQDQLVAQSQALTLLEMEKEGLKDSSEYRAELVAQEAERLQKLLDQKKITEEQAQDALRLYEETSKVTAEIDASANSAKGLTSALKEAASAMSSLSSFGAGLDKAIAVAAAKVGALKAGADEAVAGRVAGLKADLEVKLSAKGLRQDEVADLRSEAEGKISTLEGLLNQGSKIRASNRSASRGGGGSKTVVDINEIIEARKKQAEQERVLIGLSGEQEVAQRTYFDLLKQNEKADIKLTDTELKGAADAIAAYEEQNRVFEEAVQIQEDIANSIANNFGDAFMSIVDGTKTAKEAFKDMARAIIKDLFRILVVEQMVKSVKGFFKFADGGAFSGGSQIQAYADGGVVGGPTFFPMAGGKTGLMGEAGPEAIMPLKRGANGKLGVQAEGGSQGNVVVNQSFNFQANGDDSVKKLIAQAAPQIANMTQKQIMDSRRRGGSMKAAFG